MAGHYASADVGRLLAQANLIIDRSGTRTLLRIAAGERGRMGKKSHTVPQQTKEDLVLSAENLKYGCAGSQRDPGVRPNYSFLWGPSSMVVFVHAPEILPFLVIPAPG